MVNCRYSGKSMARVNALFSGFSVWASDDRQFKGFLYWRLHLVCVFFSIRIFLFKLWLLIVYPLWVSAIVSGRLPPDERWIYILVHEGIWVLSRHHTVCAGVCSVDEHRQQENYAVDTQKAVLLKMHSKRPQPYSLIQNKLQWKW